MNTPWLYAQLATISGGDVIAVLVALLTGGGLAAFLTTVIKAPKEAGKIVIDSAQGAVVVQSGVIKDLNDQNQRQQQRIDALELQRERDQRRITVLELEREQDRQKIADLQHELDLLRAEVQDERN